MKFKLFVAVVILCGCFGRIYAMYIEGQASVSISMRDSEGFVIDKMDVPLTASENQMDRYRRIIDRMPPAPRKDLVASVNEEEAPEVTLSGKKLESDTPMESPPIEDAIAGEQMLQNLPPPPESPVVESGISPALREKLHSLISCKTKDARSRIPPAIWNQIVKKAKVTEYIVKENQSLPEISQTIFGEPDCWPKLWSQNPNIENPHDIAANTKIVIIPDPVVRAPSSK